LSVIRRDIAERDEEGRERLETEASRFLIQGRNDNSSSQDSLVSTGSNEILKSELEKTIACVKAVVEEAVGEKEKVVHAEGVMAEELASMPAGSRHHFGRKFSQAEGEALTNDRLLGARPRAPIVTPRASKLSSSDKEGILLKQSSWGSRFRLTDEPSEDRNNSSFVRRKDLWEKRSNVQPPNINEEVNSGFQGNRDFWQSRSTPRSQTLPTHAPDLVMDLPTGPLASSPPIPAPRPRHVRRSRSPSSDSLASNTSSSSESPARNSVSLTTADNFAAETDTLKKSQAAQHSKTISNNTSTPKHHVQQTPIFQVVSPSSPGQRTPNSASSLTAGLVSTPKIPFCSRPGSFKPAVKVKPILQVKPTELKKDLPTESE